MTHHRAARWTALAIVTAGLTVFEHLARSRQLRGLVVLSSIAFASYPGDDPRARGRERRPRWRDHVPLPRVGHLVPLRRALVTGIDRAGWCGEAAPSGVRACPPHCLTAMEMPFVARPDRVERLPHRGRTLRARPCRPWRRAGRRRQTRRSSADLEVVCRRGSVCVWRSVQAAAVDEPHQDPEGETQ